MKYVILGIPVSVNHIYSRNKGRTFKSAEALVWEKSFVEQVRAIINRDALHPQRYFRTVKPPVAVTILWYPPDKRRRDVDNALKSIMDCFVKAGVIEDDSWKVARKVSIEVLVVDRKFPRLEVEILHYECYGEEDLC